MVVAVEVVLVKYNYSYHPHHGDAMSYQLLVGVLTRKTAARLQVWYRERSCGGNPHTHEGCIVPRAKGYKHDWFEYN